MLTAASITHSGPFLPPPSPREFVLVMAGFAERENDIDSPRTVVALRAIAETLGIQDLGAFVGAISQLTTFLMADVEQPILRQLLRQRELCAWFRHHAEASVWFGCNVPVQADARCGAVWSQIADGLRGLARARRTDPVASAELCRQARLFRAEARALREYLGAPSKPKESRPQ